MEIENCLMRFPYGLMHRRRSCCCRRVRACAKSISDGFSGVGSSGFCEQRNVVGWGAITPVTGNKISLWKDVQLQKKFWSVVNAPRLNVHTSFDTMWKSTRKYYYLRWLGPWDTKNCIPKDGTGEVDEDVRVMVTESQIMELVTPQKYPSDHLGMWIWLVFKDGNISRHKRHLSRSIGFMQSNLVQMVKLIGLKSPCCQKLYSDLLSKHSLYHHLLLNGILNPTIG